LVHLFIIKFLLLLLKFDNFLASKSRSSISTECLSFFLSDKYFNLTETEFSVMIAVWLNASWYNLG
jgi:hypothetical protein